MTSDDAHLRAAFSSLAEDAVSTPVCPEPQALWAAVRGEAPPSEARRLVLHVAECPVCAEAWRLARETGLVSSPAASAEVPARSGPAWRSRATLLAAAASVALATALAVIAPGPEPSRPASFRENEAASLRSLVPESRLLPRGECVLRWSGGPEGARYALRVVTETLDPIERVQGLSRPDYQVPEAKLRALPSGARLLWQVEATGPQGARQTSATFVARLQ